MPSKEEFVQQAAQILSDSGFEVVDASAGDSIQAIHNRETSVLMKVHATSMDGGEPVVLIRSLAVTNFESPESEKLLELLLILNKLNSDQFFGTWYLSTDPMLVVLEHSLLVNYMNSEEFALIVGMIEATANLFDDELSEFLAGETAKETMLKHSANLGTGQV